MDFTTQSPFAAIKKVVLAYLRAGCAGHDVEPQFVDVAGALPWQFINEDEFAEIRPPCFLVALDGVPDPVTETWPQGWIVPITVMFYAPQSATEEWLQEVQEALFRLLHGVWHASELENAAERTPLARRLTIVAQEITPPVDIYVAYTTGAVPRRIGVIGQAVEIRMDLDICCAMHEPL